MTNATITSSPGHEHHLFGRFETWLAQRGTGAWIALIALTILALHHVWIIALLVLAYALFGGCLSDGGRFAIWRRGTGDTKRPSDNTAFAAYKADTLRRLKEEQTAFEEFLKRLHAARDRAEFDDFMDEQAWNRSGRRSD